MRLDLLGAPFGRPLPLAGTACSAAPSASADSSGMGIVILPLEVGMMLAEREKLDQHATLEPKLLDVA